MGRRGDHPWPMYVLHVCIQQNGAAITAVQNRAVTGSGWLSAASPRYPRRADYLCGADAGMQDARIGFLQLQHCADALDGRVPESIVTNARGAIE